MSSTSSTDHDPIVDVHAARDHNAEHDTAPHHRSPQELLALLNERGIAYTLFHHPPLHTIEDAITLRGDLSGGYVKNLYLRDRSGHMALVVCESRRVVNLQRLRHALGYRRLSFASAERLWDDLGVRPGSVSPLALCNARPGALRCFADLALREYEMTNLHPLHNEMTVQLAWRAWEALCLTWGFEVEWINFDDL